MKQAQIAGRLILIGGIVALLLSYLTIPSQGPTPTETFPIMTYQKPEPTHKMIRDTISPVHVKDQLFLALK